MDRICSNALIHGYERMAAWSDLLDRINVFPVADADTGRNLKISLAPLRQLNGTPEKVSDHLIRAATGNSGNIAAAFFYELLQVRRADQLPDAIRKGMLNARQAVADPQPGTMLTVFDVFSRAVPHQGPAPSEWDCAVITSKLQQSVADSREQLPALQHAGVVDAGALGMFIFLEAFLRHITNEKRQSRPVTEIFRDRLSIGSNWQPDAARTDRYCVNITMAVKSDTDQIRQHLAHCAKSVVVTENQGRLKVHLHTDDRKSLRSGLESMGTISGWSEELITDSAGEVKSLPRAIHIMTDAAGSFTADDARHLGVTLLSSYLVVGEQAWPETLFEPERLYNAMRAGVKVSTAQASVFERHQSYLSAVSRFDKVLYLCVGSVYTGNYESAVAWKAQHDSEDRLSIIDSGAASGRLGIAALATADFAGRTDDPQAVVRFALKAMTQSEELVFLDKLKYLAAGGRISKTKGFFGDLLNKKPIITPAAHGAAKVGVVSSLKEQLRFALDRLEANFSPDTPLHILLQYSDNRDWVEAVAAGRIQAMLPSAKIVLRPLSLTSGAHMGPGTWAMAYLPQVTIEKIELGK